jgi:hypothetical protein
MAGDEELYLKGACTPFGKVDVTYAPQRARRRIVADVRLRLRTPPRRILVRFRAPWKTPMKAVYVNGKRRAPTEAAKGDVDITGAIGRVLIEARF